MFLNWKSDEKLFGIVWKVGSDVHMFLFLYLFGICRSNDYFEQEIDCCGQPWV